MLDANGSAAIRNTKCITISTANGKLGPKLKEDTMIGGLVGRKQTTVTVGTNSQAAVHRKGTDGLERLQVSSLVTTSPQFDPLSRISTGILKDALQSIYRNAPSRLSVSANIDG